MPNDGTDEPPLEIGPVVLYPPKDAVAPAIERLFVSARLCENGDLCIDGQDLSGAGPGGEEYEYTHTVAPEDISTVAAALGGSRDDVLELLVMNGARIVEQGERHWLNSLGLEPRFFSWP